ncbi:MAG: malto-oligosyltrehalose synthase [Luteibacter sp.]|uniref:malto-oligosyltrehalose synthase n=1 Tax=Luteibacter sp. TaxID=1886636 RepID=UPI002806B5E9|nr:malto-oligosyltrehalose synthase [Luteibacter sp.]MDQ7995222.1 malto-oligosyltrehalose synthase [Luteibacter sp.]
MPELSALARLQMHADFGFADAARVAPYYAALGISHLYLSPILTARKGSTHGYDVADPTTVNAELGGEAGLHDLVRTLRGLGMGLVIDIVPNHMGTGAENQWWDDVLMRGKSSRYARFFDIDWQSPDPAVRGRVGLPVLGMPVDEAIAQGHIKVVGSGDAARLEVHGDSLPLAPGSAGSSPTGDAEDLLALLDRQHYRLLHWSLGSDLVNYRRFFDVSELVALQTSDTTVFEESHRAIFRLYEEGLIDGVRCDHVDGLSDPRRYCRLLRRRLEGLKKKRPSELRLHGPWIWVEKIVAEGESLRLSWQTDGTTGYEFMDQVSGVLHDADGAATLNRLWADLTGDSASFEQVAHAARRQILVDSFQAELDRCARGVFQAARALNPNEAVSLAGVRRALAELIVHFPVYRTYAGSTGRDAQDEAVFEHALAGAMRTIRPEDADTLAKVAGWLGGTSLRELSPGRPRRALATALKVFQQSTSPVAAKAVEDTAGYRYGRLLSRNEVGVDAGQLAITPAAFHRLSLARQQTFPFNILSTATHDHKRGEDVRARLAVLSELAPMWSETARGWWDDDASLRREVKGRLSPSPADALMLYQTLVGAWPMTLSADDDAGAAAFEQRVGAWQVKALREAKRRSRWTVPDEAYEAACLGFLHALMQPLKRARTADFVQRIAAAGAVNGLNQAILRLTTPGVPDLYQGTDYWDLSLVDPDNRFPVDFSARECALRSKLPLPALIEHWTDGRIKQAFIARLLAARAHEPHLFTRGTYEPLTVTGSRASHLLAFRRQWRGSELVVVTGRHLSSELLDASSIAIRPDFWEGTRTPIEGDGWTNLLTGQTQAVDSVSHAMGGLPGAVLLRRASDR